MTPGLQTQWLVKREVLTSETTFQKTSADVQPPIKNIYIYIYKRITALLCRCKNATCKISLFTSYRISKLGANIIRNIFLSLSYCFLCVWIYFLCVCVCSQWVWWWAGSQQLGVGANIARLPEQLHQRSAMHLEHPGADWNSHFRAIHGHRHRGRAWCDTFCHRAFARSLKVDLTGFVFGPRDL